MNFDQIIADNQIIFWAIALAAAVVYLRRDTTKQAIEDNKTLAATRGERIDDLEEQIARNDKLWQKKCDQMMTDISELRGQMKQMQDLKTTEIIMGVKEGFRDIILELHEEGRL